MIEIKLEEASTLTLEMKIDGDVKNDAPELRFSILAEGMRYSFNSTQTSKGVYQIDFPVLEGKIDAGEYNAQVEITVGDKYFVPLQETVKFTKKVKPVVKLAEQMKKLDDTEVKIKVGSVSKSMPMVQITDVRALIANLNEGVEIDTDFALKALNSLALNESAIIGKTKIAPKRTLAESEAIAALRLIKENGSDLETRDAIWEGIRSLSPKAATELRSLLVDKGLSSRVLKSHGF